MNTTIAFCVMAIVTMCAASIAIGVLFLRDSCMEHVNSILNFPTWLIASGVSGILFIPVLYCGCQVAFGPQYAVAEVPKEDEFKTSMPNEPTPTSHGVVWKQATVCGFDVDHSGVFCTCGGALYILFYLAWFGVGGWLLFTTVQFSCDDVLQKFGITLWSLQAVPVALVCCLSLVR
jgi:hypothetical protein